MNTHFGSILGLRVLDNKSPQFKTFQIADPDNDAYTSKAEGEGQIFYAVVDDTEESQDLFFKNAEKKKMLPSRLLGTTPGTHRTDQKKLAFFLQGRVYGEGNEPNIKIVTQNYLKDKVHLSTPEGKKAKNTLLNLSKPEFEAFVDRIGLSGFGVAKIFMFTELSPEKLQNDDDISEALLAFQNNAFRAVK